MAEGKSTIHDTEMTSKLDNVNWADETNEYEDDSIHEKLNTLIDMVTTINIRLNKIENKLNNTTPINIKQKLTEEIMDTKIQSQTLSNIVKSMNDTKDISNVGSDELTEGNCDDKVLLIKSPTFENILDLFSIPFIITQYGINLENKLDFRLIDSFMDKLKEYTKSKFQISDTKKRIITHNLQQFYGLSIYKGIISTFEIKSKEDLCIAQIKSQTIPDESEQDFIYRSSAMIIFQETFEIYNSKCNNNILRLFKNLFDFSLIELVDEKVSEKEDTRKTVKFKSHYEKTLEDIWSYIEIEKKCYYHKSGRCQYKSDHGIYTH